MSLPWEEVNRLDAMDVAAVLGLDDAPREIRKWVCPACDGWALHAYEHGYYCWSHCGGKAYTNVDLAMVQWNVDAAEACKLLARRFGIALPDDSPPPHKAVNQYDRGRVAAVLGLVPADEPRHWRCPGCNQDGVLRQTRSSWRCLGPCETVYYNNVDLAMRAWSLPPNVACRRLAGLLGIATAPTPLPVPRAATTPRPPRLTAQQKNLAALDALDRPVRPSTVYQTILGHLTLDGAGAEHLAGRGLDVARAASYGFRTANPEDWRSRIMPYLETLRDEELAAAGFPREHQDETTRIILPWGWWTTPLLLLPYRDEQNVFAIRFRNLSPSLGEEGNDDPKYLTLRAASPLLPFNAAALRHSRTIHLVEGELNAYTLAEPPYRALAIGMPGAGTWRDEWSTALAAADTIVAWYDNDKAGRHGAKRVYQSLCTAHGEEWATRRWRSLIVDHDANHLHQDHRLGRWLRQRPWDEPSTRSVPIP